MSPVRTWFKILNEADPPSVGQLCPELENEGICKIISLSRRKIQKICFLMGGLGTLTLFREP